MCYQFLPLIALAATAAGTGASVVGQQKAKHAMQDATQAERIRQKGIQDRAAGAFDESLAQSDKSVADEQIKQGEQERLQGYRNLQQIPVAVPGGQLVGGQNPAMVLQDQALANASNRSRAKLGSYDKWQLDQAVKNTRATQQQALYGQQAQRSQALLPMELQDASHKGDTWQGVGMGLSALGTLASMGSLAGVGAGGQAALTAPQVAAFNTGLGPVSTGFANSVYGMTAPAYAAQNAANIAAQSGTSLSNLFGAGLGGSGLYNLNRRY